MKNKNKVYIATSLDGYIADKNGSIEWLNTIPIPEDTEMGFNEFTSQIDALVMGRTTFETVCGFDVEWPYKKPVFVLSNTLIKVPEKFKEKAQVVNGNLNNVLEDLHKKGFHNLYIDGGKTIQSFLKEDLIDEIVITIIPVLLGAGSPLFSDLAKPLNFNCVRTELFLDKIVQNHFVRIR